MASLTILIGSSRVGVCVWVVPGARDCRRANRGSLFLVVFRGSYLWALDMELAVLGLRLIRWEPLVYVLRINKQRPECGLKPTGLGSNCCRAVRKALYDLAPAYLRFTVSPFCRQVFQHAAGSFLNLTCLVSVNAFLRAVPPVLCASPSLTCAVGTQVRFSLFS